MLQKISNYTLNLSPKKLAIFLLLIPLLWVFVYTISSIIFSPLSGSFTANGIVGSIVLGLLLISLSVMVAFWLCWFYTTANSVEETELGLSMRWFHFAMALLVVYLLYNLCYYSLIEAVNENYRFIFHATSEFIAFGGLLIVYPLLCHYAARAAVVKKTNEPATLIKAIPFTLLLFFGAVIVMPFLHKHFSTKTSSNSEIISVYVKAFAVFMTVLVIGFLASVTGFV